MESFEQLTTQYTPMIYKIIRSLHIYKNKDEFFQLALIGLWEASEKFEPSKGNFTNYAYSMIKGKIQNEMTKVNKIEDTMTIAKEEYWHNIVDEAAILPLEEDILLVYCKNGKLTENQTKWVLYHFIKGFSVKEVADMEHVSISAVKAWRTGALNNLRK